MNPKVRNLLVSIYQETLYPFIKKENYQAISRNKKFKGIHEGKRCFILGNGPSLKEQDLSILKDEYVFTVNQSSKNPQFPSLCSDYHFCIDQSFFTGSPEDAGFNELLDSIIRVNVNLKNEKPECFFPINQMGFVKKYGLDKELQVNYLSMQHIMVDSHFPTDLSKPIPRSQTVVHTCIIAAIYMGFKEIYLLGCDNTGIVVNVNSYLKQNTDADYAYHVTDSEKKRMERLFEKHPLEEYVLAFYKCLVNYRNISNYCKRKNIVLKNCTPKSTIESIEMIKLEEVIK